LVLFRSSADLDPSGFVQIDPVAAAQINGILNGIGISTLIGYR
jgi:hypothetical protein